MIRTNLLKRTTPILLGGSLPKSLQNKLRFLRRSQVLWAHNLWELLCADVRHSAGLHARVILDGATCRLSDLGDVLDVTECFRCVVGKVGEEAEVLKEEGA